MVLKFDELIYKRTFTIETKDGQKDIIVKITDKESMEITELLIEILQGVYEGDRLDEILFKDNLSMLREILVGANYVRFQRVVLADFQNFLQGLIDETIKQVVGQ